MFVIKVLAMQENGEYRFEPIGAGPFDTIDECRSQMAALVARTGKVLRVFPVDDQEGEV